MSEFSRCRDCGRILPLNARGSFAPHKVPQTMPTYLRGVKAAVPLTGRDSPWCEGSNK
jgi:hypothetical protein